VQEATESLVHDYKIAGLQFATTHRFLFLGFQGSAGVTAELGKEQQVGAN